MELAEPRLAVAIPVFAYVHRMTCGTCPRFHPQLNPVGEPFSAQGTHGLRPMVEPIPRGSHFALPGTPPNIPG